MYLFHQEQMLRLVFKNHYIFSQASIWHFMLSHVEIHPLFAPKFKSKAYATNIYFLKVQHVKKKTQNKNKN